MARIVQKFGGTSIADLPRIRQAAQTAVKAASDGHEVTTVVSAMGDTTDELIALAEGISSQPNPREMDILLATGEQQSIALMSMAIQELGWPARSFTGAQAGIVTENEHGSARIKEVKPNAIESSLARGEIAVVAGFQGISTGHELTTLGRGGSDTTAVVLANALEAERCDIYTDVNGVFTADPRLFKQARKISCISYEEMLELAATGAQVMNHRSVQLAMQEDLPVRIRSAFQPDDLGTLITHRSKSPSYPICGITLDTNLSFMSLKLGLKQDQAKVLEGIASFFTRLNELSISTDMVMLLAREDEPLQELLFTVEKRVTKRISSIIENLAERIGEFQLASDNDLARVSLIGQNLTTKPSVIASAFEILSQSAIPVQMVATGDLRMSVLLPHTRAHEAVKLLHNQFGLEQ